MFGLNDDHHKDEHKNEQQEDGVTVTPETASEDVMPSAPVGDDSSVSTPADDDMAKAVDELAQDSPETHKEPAAPLSSPADNDGLLNLKRQALENLAPLVSHLDQSPEEKFKTTMMMIQATDDSSLVQQAYESAQKIQDEKVKAQALLDIVNEINYFTQHNK